jgi:predicted nucleic acid-binding protein
LKKAEKKPLKNINAEEQEIEKQFVVDVNIIFSGILSRKEIYKKIFSEYTLYTPDFAFIELNKYREKMLKKAKKISAEDLRNFTLFIFSKIVVVPDYLISEKSYKKAEKLVKSVDIKDVAYVALAVEFNLILLTQDRKLYEGLKAKGFEKIKLFADFIEKISV